MHLEFYFKITIHSHIVYDIVCKHMVCTINMCKYSTNHAHLTAMSKEFLFDRTILLYYINNNVQII